MSKRSRFFFGHLFFSIILGLLSIFLVFKIWYPFPLAQALGVIPLFVMLIIIDIIVGPLFTLLIYKEGKKSLKFDLTTVIVLQIAAFGYGMYMISQGRPAWIVYDAFNFVVVKNSDIERKNIEQADIQFQKPSWFHPTIVATQNVLPTERDTFLKGQTKNSTAIRYPVYYTNFENAKRRLKMNALPIDLLEKYNDKNKVSTILKEYPNANAWMGLSAPAQEMVVLINRDKGEVVKIVDLKPW